jgi:WD40 repeat protein
MKRRSLNIAVTRSEFFSPASGEPRRGILIGSLLSLVVVAAWCAASEWRDDRDERLKSLRGVPITPTPEVTMIGHQGGEIVGLGFTEDGKYLWSGGEDRTARMWDTRTGKEILKLDHPDPLRSLAVSPKRNLLATGSDSVRVWDSLTGKPDYEISGRSFRLTFSPDGKFLAFPGRADSAVTIVRASTGEVLKEFDTVERDGKGGYRYPVRPSTFSHDGRYYASADKGEITIRDTTDWEPVASLSGGGRLEFLPNGHLLTFSTKDRVARVRAFDWVEGRLVSQLHDSNSAYNGVFAVSPDGRLIAIEERDSTFQLWDLNARRVLKGFEFRYVHRFGITAIAFSPDSKRLAAVSTGSSRIAIWDISSYLPTTKPQIGRAVRER